MPVTTARDPHPIGFEKKNGIPYQASRFLQLYAIAITGNFLFKPF